MRRQNALLADNLENQSLHSRLCLRDVKHLCISPGYCRPFYRAPAVGAVLKLLSILLNDQASAQALIGWMPVFNYLQLFIIKGFACQQIPWKKEVTKVRMLKQIRSDTLRHRNTHYSKCFANMAYGK
jgi:hypothetical protein